MQTYAAKLLWEHAVIRWFNTLATSALLEVFKSASFLNYFCVATMAECYTFSYLVSQTHPSDLAVLDNCGCYQRLKSLVLLPSWWFKNCWNIPSPSPKSRKRVNRCDLISQDWNWNHLGTHSSTFMTTLGSYNHLQNFNCSLIKPLNSLVLRSLVSDSSQIQDSTT